MATGTGPCRSAPADQSHQSPDELGEDDLNVVLEVLSPVAAKYAFLGVAMNVKMNEIKNIQSQFSDPRRCLLEVLSVRLSQIPSLTWRDVYTALRSDTVGEPQLADRIRRQYGHLYSPDPSFEASLDQEQGRKMSQITKSKKKAKKEKSAKKYMQQDSDKEVSESERYRKPSKKVQMDVNEAVVKKTQQKANYTKMHSMPGKQYIENESKRERETQRKKKATKYDKGSQVVCGSQHRHKVKHSEQRAQKEVQIKSESESSASSSDNSDSTEKSYSSEQEEDSAEEVSETERYQKPSELPEFPQSYQKKTKESFTPLSKNRVHKSQIQNNIKGKQKKKAVDQSDSENEFFSACEEQSPTPEPIRRIIPSMKYSVESSEAQRAPEKVQREVGNSATSSKDEASNSSVYSKTREKGKTSTKKKILKHVHKKTQRHKDVIATQQHKQPTTVQTDSENEYFSACDEPSPTPEPKRKKLDPQGDDRKRKDPCKYQRTLKCAKLEQYSATSDDESPSNHSGTEMSIDKSPAMLAEGPNSDISDMEEGQHDTLLGIKKRVRSNSPFSCCTSLSEGRSSSSESDDESSPPEGDMLRNLTVSECNSLIKSFECSFGKLCCAIKKPEKAAAELHARHLLSKGNMETLCKSPESKQMKVIALVKALKERVKSRPHRVFSYIEVFIHNDILKEAGRELWNETGKVCPNRTVSVLGHEFPPSQRLKTMESAFNMSEEDITASYDIAKNIILPHGTKGASGMAPYPSVCKSVLQSGVSPALAQYKKYLQSCYNARVLAPADKYLPTLESPYINLAMIRRGCYNHEQRDEFTRRTLHGGVDQILENKTPINIEDLLTPEDRDEGYQMRAISQTAEGSKKPVRFILVEGPPGIGKSTFAWEVCRRWDEIKTLRDYHTVVLLKLRERWVLNATSLSDLFRFPFKPEFSKDIAEELYNSLGVRLLLVLDGFDEVSHSFHENSVIKSILCRQLLPECTIILTTRPVAKATLRSIYQPRVDKHVEIIGFTEEERVRYITEVFSKEPELQVNFLEYMFLIPHIKSMMYIPLNCAIIAQIYYESQSSRHLTMPRTRTQLYKALTHSLLFRHMRAMENNCEYTSMLPEGLDEENMAKFETLAKFAYDSYHECLSGDGDNNERKVTFFKEDIPEGLVHFGFMNESTEMYATKGVERTFSFLHLSLQEYLVAWHLADSGNIKRQVEYHRMAADAKKYKGGEVLVEPAIFLAGITGWRCLSEDDRNHWEMYLSHDTKDVEDPRVLLRSLYEAQNPTLCPYYYAAKSGNRRKISIGSFGVYTSEIKILVPYDCYALSYCLAHSSDQFISLSIGISGDDDVSLVETFSKGLNDHCKSTTPKVTIFKMHQTTKSVKNSENSLFWLTKANCWTELKELVFVSESSVSNDHAYEFLERLIKVQFFFIHIPSCKWLPALKILNDRELKGFHINNHRHHQQVTVTSYSLTKAILNIKFDPKDDYNKINLGINSLLKSVLRSNQITEMVLSDISRETMAGVHNILLHCPSLTTLELKRTRLGYDGILHICSALRNNTTLRHLVIHDDLQLLPSRNDAIVSGTTCTDLLLELSNIVKDNTLEEMNIQCKSKKGTRMEFDLKLCNVGIDVAHNVLQTLIKIQSLKDVKYCEWLASPESLHHLQKLHICNKLKCDSMANVLNIKFPTTTISPNGIVKSVGLVIELVIQLNMFDKVLLSDVSRETMAGVHNILLHCPSLTTLELKRTRLGYDGILYICSALRNNTTLRHLVIHDDLQLPPSFFQRNFTGTFSSMERVLLPSKTTCTDFLLELNNILKDNTTLEEIKIQSGLFIPLSASRDKEYCQLTGLGPLQQFNVGAVGSGMSPNLRRSFSSSDLTQPQTTLFWKRELFRLNFKEIQTHEVDFKKLFSMKKVKGKKLFSLPSFTAPDTEVLQSFSGLDPRLKKCLKISHLHRYLERLKETCWGMLRELNDNQITFK